MKLTLSDIEKACRGKIVFPVPSENEEGSSARREALSKEVECVVVDSRKICSGGVFIATEGEKVDGHSFIGQVFEKGAALVITQKTPEAVEEGCKVPASFWGAYLLVEDSFAVLRAIGAAYRRKLSIPVIGITGSVGKTSTKEFVAGVLGTKFNVLKTEGNYNNEIGVPLTLLRIRPEHEVAVIEMGINHFGEMTNLTNMAAPDIAMITNIGQCHLEFLYDRNGILDAKTEIFKGMGACGEVCLQGEDDKLQTIGLVNGKRPHFFGTGENPEEQVYVSDIRDKGLEGSEVVLHFAPNRASALPEEWNHNYAHRTIDAGLPERLQVFVPLPGIHMVINATAAATVAMLLGMTGEEIKSGIENMQPINGRNRIVSCTDYTLIDDCYNANPVSMRSSIDLLKIGEGMKIAILGDMFELGEEAPAMHAGVGAYAVASQIDELICIGELSKAMYLGALAELKWNKGKTIKARYFATREIFMEELEKSRKELIPDGSAVLIKASHGMHFEAIVEKLAEEK